MHERGRNLRPGGKGNPNGRSCFLGGSSNICLGDSNWRERHISCPFRSGGLALMEAAHDHVEAGHAQLLAVTSQIE